MKFRPIQRIRDRIDAFKKKAVRTVVLGGTAMALLISVLVITGLLAIQWVLKGCK